MRSAARLVWLVVPAVTRVVGARPGSSCYALHGGGSMAVFAAMYRFSHEPPPSREQVNSNLQAQVGINGRLAGYRRDGRDVLIYTSPDAFTPAYAMKVMRDLGGVLIDFETREPLNEPLPEFVEKPWLEHDEATRGAIVLAFEHRSEERRVGKECRS